MGDRQRQPRVQAPGRAPVQRHPRLQGRDPPQSVAGARDALLPAVPAASLYRHAGIEMVGERSGDEPVQPKALEAAVCGVDALRERRGRLGRDVVHGPAGGVFAEERALRPLEHLHPRQVEAHQPRHRRIGQRRLVNIDRHRARRGEVAVEEADAAQGEGGRVEGAVLDRQARRQPVQVLHRVDAARPQGRAARRADRHAYRVGGLLLLLGGDHHLGERRSLRGGRPRRTQQRERAHRPEQTGKQARRLLAIAFPVCPTQCRGPTSWSGRVLLDFGIDAAPSRRRRNTVEHRSMTEGW